MHSKNQTCGQWRTVWLKLRPNSKTHLFGCRGRSLRFHWLSLLFTGRFGSLALLLFSWKRWVAGRTWALAVFKGIWRERIGFSTVWRHAGWADGGFRFIKSRRTGSILVLFTFGFHAHLTVVDGVVLKEKQCNTVIWSLWQKKPVQRGGKNETQKSLVTSGETHRTMSTVLTLFLSLRSFSSFFSLDRPCGVSKSFFSCSLSRLLDRATEL